MTILLKICSFIIIFPQDPSSNRIIILIDEPTIPDHMAKRKYRIPISLWFVDSIHLFILSNGEGVKCCV